MTNLRGGSFNWKLRFKLTLSVDHGRNFYFYVYHYNNDKGFIGAILICRCNVVVVKSPEHYGSIIITPTTIIISPILVYNVIIHEKYG